MSKVGFFTVDKKLSSIIPRNWKAVGVAFTLLVSFWSIAADKKDHSAHSRVGSHGMALFTDGTQLYAHHLPLYRAPHDYQIIYQVETQNADEIMRLLEKGMVTLLPEQFDLNILVAGESPTFDTQVFEGHFERGGTLTIQSIQLHFAKQIYLRPLNDLSKREGLQVSANYSFVDLSGSKHVLAIHNIQVKPSFDHVVLLSGSVECLGGGLDSEILLKEAGDLLPEKLLNGMPKCASANTLYWETNDFSN